MAPTDGNDVGDPHRQPSDGGRQDAPREGSPAETARSARHGILPRRPTVAGNSPARQYRVGSLGTAWVDTPSAPSSRPPPCARLTSRPLPPLPPVGQYPGGGLPDAGYRLAAATNLSGALVNGLGQHMTPPNTARACQPNQSNLRPAVNRVLHPNPLRQHPPNRTQQDTRSGHFPSPPGEKIDPNPLRETIYPNPPRPNPPDLVEQQGSGVALTRERLAELNYHNTRSDILSSVPDRIAEFRDHQSSVYPFVPEPTRLYGQLAIVNHTRVFRATRRMEGWIAGVTAGLDVPDPEDSEHESGGPDSHQDCSGSQGGSQQQGSQQHGFQRTDGRMLPPPRPGQTGQDQDQSQGHSRGHYQYQSHSRGHTHNLNFNTGQMMDLGDLNPAKQGAKNGTTQDDTARDREQNSESPMLQLGDTGSVGLKRPFDLDQLHVPRKRARVSDTVRRTFSKMSRLSSSHAPTVRRRTDDIHTCYAKDSDEADEDMNIHEYGADHQDAATTTVYNVDDPKTREGTRSVLRDATRDVMTATRQAFSRLSIASGVVQPEPPRQTRLQICILGDANAGKTALISRLMANSFVKTKPSTATDCRTVPVIASDGRVVLLELWDFPGTPSLAGGIDRLRQLRAAFFHAAVLCYSIEEKRNPAAVVSKWKPFLDQGLVECDRYVLGLKRDTRPDHPTVELLFLEKPAKPANIEDGQNVAKAVGAAGFGECSSKTGQNISESWSAIVDSVLAGLEGRHERTRARRRNRAREAASEFFAKAARGFRY